ncbi:carbon-nitrogen hydrolase family protein [Paenibacillus oryzisoli]|uniref:CN hydrolase domain-containing protein n=1 Tax=Paenibacillus oryzisoli TaxID=1850517 RepID=A0A198A9V6_9BACL|nr:carbon-nitrogen hydrolase family protein [Paenibacillus oryzisoli]OAS17890.1 hypothetical protein A8708_28140 [Paenibacillus oryzisoli]
MNSIMRMEDGDWQIWTPREELSPSYTRIESAEGLGLEIHGAGKHRCYGSWHSRNIRIKEYHSYVIQASYTCRNIGHEHVSIYAIATWMDAEGLLIQRDYLDRVDEHEALVSMRKMRRELESPSRAAYLRLELSFRWSGEGHVVWKDVSVQEHKETYRKAVRVVTTYARPTEDRATNLHLMLNLLDKAGQHHPDLVVLTETFYEGFVQLPLEERCQAIPGPLTKFVSEKARELRSYVLYTMYEREGTYIYNTAVLIDREGEIAGKYRKIHLPLYEAEMGVTPGDEHVVLTTDFGRVGILTCHDQEFPESARILALQGAEVICIPTIGNGLLQTRARARDNGLHVVVAGCGGGVSSSRIIAPSGELIGHVENEESGVFAADLDLNKRLYKYWLSVGPGNGEPRSLYLKERRPDTYGDLIDISSDGGGGS